MAVAVKDEEKVERGRPPKLEDKLVQITTHLREDQILFIDKLAQRRTEELRIEVVKSDIIRQAVDDLMDKVNKEAKAKK